VPRIVLVVTPLALLGAALLASTAGGWPIAPAAARAADIFVEVSPSTAAAGDVVGVRASCDDNLRSATVVSDFAEPVELQPGFGWLTGQVRVPGDVAAGDYPLALRCASGMTAQSTLHVGRDGTPDPAGPDCPAACPAETTPPAPCPDQSPTTTAPPCPDQCPTTPKPSCPPPVACECPVATCPTVEPTDPGVEPTEPTAEPTEPTEPPETSEPTVEPTPEPTSGS
jgi:hypothetical protein